VTRTNRILLGAVALAAALAAYWMLLLAPKREEAAQLGEKVAAKQRELQQAQADVVAYERARGSYPANYATVARLGKAVPVDDDTRSLMVQLDAAARGTNVDFRTLQLGGAGGPTPAGAPAGGANATPLPPGAVSIGAAGFSALPFSFAFRGSFTNLSELFTRLERFVTVKGERVDVRGRLLRVESFTLEPDQVGWPAIRAKIGATSFVAPAQTGATAGGLAPATPATAGAQPAVTPTPTATPSTTTASVTNP